MMRKFLQAACLLIVLAALPIKGFAQIFLVENIDSKGFPKMRFQIRSSDDLVRNKAALQIRDNNIPVKVYTVAKAAAGSPAEDNAALFDVVYTVLDAKRMDGTVTFDYRGQQVNTAYYIKTETTTPAANAPAAKPATSRTTTTTAITKEEEGTPWLVWFIGGLAVVGIGAFLLTRRKKSASATREETYQPAPPVPAPAPVVPPVAPPVAQPSAPAHAPYMPPVATAPSNVAETVISGAPRAVLTCTVDGRSITFNLTGNRQTIGRAPDNDLVIPHPTVSAHHAVVSMEGGRWMLEDLSSTNGTYVSGSRITKITLSDTAQLHFAQVPTTFKRA